MSSMADEWVTIRQAHRATVKVQRSEFIGVAFPCVEEEEFQERLRELTGEFFDATHHCWALRLFAGGEQRMRSSDAGEPCGSAGKPIASAIESAGLSDVGVVVIRYYGGVKLGTGGLGRAYREAAQLALAGSASQTRYLYDEVALEVPFPRLSLVYRMIDPPHVLLEGEEYGETNVFRFRVRRSRVETFIETADQERLTRRGAPSGSGEASP